MHFLSDTLREKAGVESDGVALTGEALGGKSPRIKVNKLQSDSDWNIQRGVEQIVRGLYQAVRNPRSHERLNDNETDAQAIVLFVGYITNIIDHSKSPFSVESFGARVLDPDFLAQPRYAELLVKEIPPRQRLNVFYEIYRKKETGKGENLSLFFETLLQELGEDEKEEISQAISDELKITDSETAIRLTIQCFHSMWGRIAEVAKLRIENRLIRSIKEGQYFDGRCITGGLGTWAPRIFPHAILKNEMLSTIISKLYSDEEEQQDYVLHYLVTGINDLFDQPNGWIERPFLEGLRREDRRFFNAAESMMFGSMKKWSARLQQAVQEFKTLHPEDDIPF